MILLGLGANLPSPAGPPAATIEAALAALAEARVVVRRRSGLYRTAPVPLSDQPYFTNAVAAIETTLAPAPLLALLHGIEHRFGRRRARPNDARSLDLDLLAYDDLIAAGGEGPILPHPRLQERGFVLLPLVEIAPEWRHPRLGLSAVELLAALPPAQQVSLPNGGK